MSIINERIRYIRKDLELSQKVFAERMGISRDVISNIEYDRTDAKDFVLKAICREYRVNYFWLTDGIGEPYLGPPDILLDDVVEKYNLENDDKEIIERYVKFDPEKRKMLKELIRNLINAPD